MQFTLVPEGYQLIITPDTLALISVSCIIIGLVLILAAYIGLRLK